MAGTGNRISEPGCLGPCLEDPPSLNHGSAEWVVLLAVDGCNAIGA